MPIFQKGVLNYLQKQWSCTMYILINPVLHCVHWHCTVFIKLCKACWYLFPKQNAKNPPHMDEGCWWERKSLKLLLLLLLPCSVANTQGSFLIRVWCTVFLTSFTHTHILDSMLKPFLISHNHYSNKHYRFCGTKSRSSA